MKNLLTLISIVLISGNIYGQESEKKYYSTQENNYYKTISDIQFKPIDKNKIEAFSLPQISISYIQDFTPFKSVYEWAPEKKALFENLPDDFSSFPKEGSSGISKADLIKKGELNGNQAILYTNNTYDNFEDSGAGIWIALFDKNSNVWRKIYTGLSEYEPIYLKWDSKLPLFKDSNHLQIEAALIRKNSPEIHPGSPPEYEVVKDGAVVLFDLTKLVLDSDNDQLYDIVETKMGLNPHHKDSDGDYIPDNLDPNPRFKAQTTELAHVYEAILLDLDHPSFNSFKIPLKPLEKKEKALLLDSAETFIIESDSKDWQSVEISNQRLIILSSEELKKHKEEYPSTLRPFEVSPLFKVDKMKDTYKLHISPTPTSGFVFLIRKKSTYWEIKVLTAWVI